jgi:hypothetical protein
MTSGFIVHSAPPSGWSHAGSLPESVLLLAQFAAHAAGAAGYSLFEEDSTNGPVARYASGPSGAQVSSRARFPIRLDGRQVATLVFGFFENPISADKLALLNQVVGAIEAVHALPHATARVAARIASLDLQLADIKIGERARGLLAHQGPASEAVEALVRHVEHVLEGRQLAALFEQLLSRLEDLVEERKLLMKAKAVLQGQHGMSEEEAYLHLKARSRSSRKRLRDIAQELISQHPGVLDEYRQGAGV